MTKRVHIIARIEKEVRTAMRRVKKAEGIPLDYQVNTALKQWLLAGGYLATDRDRRTRER